MVDFIYESFSHTWRGIFGPTPKVGEVWEFAGKNEDAFRVLVEGTTPSHVNYKFVVGTGTTHRLTTYRFRVCYKPKVSH